MSKDQRVFEILKFTPGSVMMDWILQNHQEWRDAREIITDQVMAKIERDGGNRDDYQMAWKEESNDGFPRRRLRGVAYKKIY